MAEQQGITVAQVMGLNRKSISSHEMEWWIARSNCRPLAPLRTDIMECRIASSMGADFSNVVGWYEDTIEDEEYAEQQLKEIRDAKEKRRLKEESKKNV
jgi:hypothetical protein